MEQYTGQMNRISCHNGAMRSFLLGTWKVPLCVSLFTLAFPPWDLSFLSWIALVPGIAIGLQTRSVRHALGLAAYASFWVNLLLFPWVYVALRDYVDLSPVAAAVAWQVFGLVCQPQLYVFAVGLHLLRKVTSPVLLALSIALLYTGVDWFAPKIFLDTLGHATHNMPRIRQVADLGGAYGITFLIVFHNVAIYCLIRYWFERRRIAGPALANYGLAAVLALVAFTYGFVRQEQVAATMAGAPRTLDVVGIQANSTGFDKNKAYAGMLEKAAAAEPVASDEGSAGQREVDAYYQQVFRELIDTHLAMSEEGLAASADADLVVWPETTYPALFGNPLSQVHVESERKMIELVEREQVSLIFGGYWRDAQDVEHNSAFHLSPFFVSSGDSSGESPVPGVSLDRYDKTNLLMLGEYFIFEDWPLVQAIFPTIRNFGRGDGSRIFTLPLKDGGTVRVTPIICYEILFGDYLRNAMADAPNVILNITNDSWFGEYGEPQLHMAFASFRALELRVPVVRITNTGVTATVLQDGSQVDRIGTSRKQVHNAVLPLAEFPPTLYERGGYRFPVIALVLGLVLTFGLAFYHRQAARG